MSSAAFQPRLLEGGFGVLVVQAIYQGLLNGVIGLWFWGIGVRVLGAGGTQLFPPLIPVIGTAMAIPLVGEWPGPLQIGGVGAIVAGLALAAFGNRPRPASSDSLSTAP